MITNDRQFRITKSQADKFREALRTFDEIDMVRRGIDPAIATAHRQSLSEQLLELEEQLRRYETLQAAASATLPASRIEEIGRALIEARVALALSQKQMAELLGMREQQIQRYEQEKYVSASLAKLGVVAAALKIDFEAVLRVSKLAANTASVSAQAVKLPVREMAKRGWLDELRDVFGSDSDVALAEKFVDKAKQVGSFASLHRKKIRVGGKFNPMALVAWKARTLQLALDSSKATPRYSGVDAGVVQEIVQLSTKADGPVRAIEALRNIGVIVVAEPHLPSTHLDGAAMLLKSETPVIGLTLRHDRLDNFWFVLMHELGHVACHWSKGLNDGFFDDESVETDDALEIEADSFARNALIPDEIWASSFVRYTRSTDKVRQFARGLKISPAIVAGRIRRERGWTVFNDLIGANQVRRMFY